MTNNELLTRGVSKVIPQKLAEEKLASGKKIRIYMGIDPTGAHLHIGHSVQLRKLKQFAEAGHEVIFLIGSYTAMIGDPTGKDLMREALTKEQVMKNFESYKEQAAKILDFSKVQIRYNHEWLEKLTFGDIIGLASNFTVQQMMQRDMFEKRVSEDKPIGVHEFMYPLMVGYDSVVLDVDCETGGTDQEFNMLAGRTLQKAMGKREKFVLTNKLIEGTDGRKMSKTYDNCIYLDESAKDIYGKTLSIKDELITLYMECCTDIPMEEIAKIEKDMKKGANPKEFKMRLARELVTMYHSAQAAEEAEDNFNKKFSNKVTHSTDALIALGIEAIEGQTLLDLIVGEGITSSSSEARRLFKQNAIQINGKKVTDDKILIQNNDLLQVGRKGPYRILVTHEIYKGKTRKEQIKNIKSLFDKDEVLKTLFEKKWISENLLFDTPKDITKVHPLFFTLSYKINNYNEFISNTLKNFAKLNINSWKEIAHQFQSQSDSNIIKSKINEIEAFVHLNEQGASTVFEPKLGNKVPDLYINFKKHNFYIEVMSIFDCENEDSEKKVIDEIRRRINEIPNNRFMVWADFCNHVSRNMIDSFVNFIEDKIQNGKLKKTKRTSTTFNYLGNKIADISFSYNKKGVGFWSGHSDPTTAREDGMRIKNRILSKIDNFQLPHAPEMGGYLIFLNDSWSDIEDIRAAIFGPLVTKISLKDHKITDTRDFEKGLLNHPKMKKVIDDIHFFVIVRETGFQIQKTEKWSKENVIIIPNENSPIPLKVLKELFISNEKNI